MLCSVIAYVIPYLLSLVEKWLSFFRCTIWYINAWARWLLCLCTKTCKICMAYRSYFILPTNDNISMMVIFHRFWSDWKVGITNCFLQGWYGCGGSQWPFYWCQVHGMYIYFFFVLNHNFEDPSDDEHFSIVVGSSLIFCFRY